MLARIPRLDVLGVVTENERMCPFGRAEVKIGEDVSEQLDYIPGQIEALRPIHPNYVCSGCKDGATAASIASVPFAGGLVALVLLAHVAVSKFIGHMPLYRPQDKLARAGS